MMLLGGSAIVTAPSQPAAALVGQALSDHAIFAIPDAETIAGLPATLTLGPASLAYRGGRPIKPPQGRVCRHTP